MQKNARQTISFPGLKTDGKQMFPNQTNMEGDQFEATIVIQTSDLRATFYPDEIIPLLPHTTASGSIVVVIYLLTFWKIANKYTYFVKSSG